MLMKMARVVFRDTLVRAFRWGMKNERKHFYRIHSDWETDITFNQALVEACLYISTNFQTWSNLHLIRSIFFPFISFYWSTRRANKYFIFETTSKLEIVFLFYLKITLPIKGFYLKSSSSWNINWIRSSRQSAEPFMLGLWSKLGLRRSALDPMWRPPIGSLDSPRGT